MSLPDETPLQISRPLKALFMAIFGVFLIVFVGFNVYSQYSTAKWQQIHHQEVVADLLVQREAEHTNGLLAILHLISINPDFIAAQRAGDREKLLDLATPQFEQLNDQFDLIHWRINDSDQEVLLHIHGTAHHGDAVGHGTMDRAVASLEPTSGIEFDRWGTPTLHVVYPWFVDGTHIGFLQLGKEISKILQNIEKAEDVTLIELFPKRLISDEVAPHSHPRERESEWNISEDLVVSAENIANLVPKTIRLINQCTENECEIDGFYFDKFNIFYANSQVLTDFSGVHYGFLLTIRDYTPPFRSIIGLTVAFAAGLIVLFLVSSIVFSRVTRNIERIVDTNRAELETQVRLRTADLAEANEALSSANSALSDQNQRLQYANDDLSRYSYVISHDLQEPLRKIALFASVVKESSENGDEGELRYAVDVLMKSAKNARQLVADILKLSRASDEDTQKTRIDFDRLMSEMDELFQDRRNSSEDIIQYRGTGRFLYADQTQISQLLSNLISNAIKYRKPGEAPYVEVWTDALDTGEITAFHVRDRGMGFEQAFAEEVFEPFKRLHTMHKRPGTGVGLAICKRIVERHDWTISASSSPGEGSCFTVSNIRNSAQAAAEAVQA